MGESTSLLLLLAANDTNLVAQFATGLSERMDVKTRRFRLRESQLREIILGGVRTYTSCCLGDPFAKNLHLLRGDILIS